MSGGNLTDSEMSGGKMRRRATLVLIVVLLLLACGLAVLAGCGGSKTAGTSTSTSAGASTGPGGSTEQQVGVPLYPGTKAEQAYAGVYKMTTTDSFDQVVAFYKKELPKATFSQTTIPTGKGAAFVVDESSFHGNVSVEENLPANGQVTVTVSRFNQ